MLLAEEYVGVGQEGEGEGKGKGRRIEDMLLTIITRQGIYAR